MNRFFLILTVVGVFSLSFSPVAAEEGELVWALRVDDGMAHLEYNQFGSGKVFPVDNIRIKRRIDNILVQNGQPQLDISFDIAPLYINEDGLLNRNESQMLAFFSEPRVAMPLQNQPFSVLGLPGDVLNKSMGTKICYLNFDPNVEGQSVHSWAKLPGMEFGLVQARNVTLFFETNVDHPPGALPLPYGAVYMHPTSGLSIAGHAGVLATVAKGNGSSGIVVFDFAGELLYEAPLQRYLYDDLYVYPEGDYLAYRRQGGSDPAELVVMEVISGIETVLTEIIDGPRYYSDDAKRMVVLEKSTGRARFYDTTEPWAPIFLWEYNAGSMLVTASICDDGSLVALQVVNSNDTAMVLKNVLVLDESSSVVSRPITDHDQSNLAGLQFEGKFLFVGTQRHHNPAEVHVATTKQINVYDYEGFGGK